MLHLNDDIVRPGLDLHREIIDIPKRIKVFEKKPHQIRFMDESGFGYSKQKLLSLRKRGNSVSKLFSRFVPGSNLPLNFLIGLDCFLYYNFVHGPSNSESFLVLVK